MNEDEDLDVVVLSTFDSLTVCCHEDLLRMPINGLLRLIVDLNSRLSAAMKITDTLTKSEDRLRMDIEAVLGYKRASPLELQTLAAASRDSGLGLLGLFSATQAPEAQAAPLTPPPPRRRGSNHSLSDRQRLTVSMLGKPRLEDLKEEEPEARNPRRPVEKSPIRRSGRQHSLAQGRCDRAGEATTLPRARSLRNFQTYEERRVRPYFFCLRDQVLIRVPRSLFGPPEARSNDLIDRISMCRHSAMSSARNLGFTIHSRQVEANAPTTQAWPVT